MLMCRLHPCLDLTPRLSGHMHVHAQTHVRMHVVHACAYAYTHTICICHIIICICHITICICHIIICIHTCHMHMSRTHTHTTRTRTHTHVAVGDLVHSRSRCRVIFALEGEFAQQFIAAKRSLSLRARNSGALFLLVMYAIAQQRCEAPNWGELNYGLGYTLIFDV